MRGKDLLECMEPIDDALVEEALEPAVFPRRNAKAVKWGMAAACVVVLGISATAFWSHQNMKKMPIEHAGDTAAPMSAAAGADSGSSGQLAEGAPTDAGAADGTGQLAGGVPTAGSAADGVQNDAGAAGKETEDSADPPVALTAADRKEEGEDLAVSVESLDESKKESDEEAVISILSSVTIMMRRTVRFTIIRSRKRERFSVTTICRRPQNIMKSREIRRKLQRI